MSNDARDAHRTPPGEPSRIDALGRPTPRPNPIEVLRARQADAGALTDDVLRAVSGEYGWPLYELEGLVSFYPHLRREPAPDVHVAGERVPEREAP